MQTDDTFAAIETAHQSGADAAINELISHLREQRRWHNLFDARMLQAKSRLNLPLGRPASLQDVPAEHRVSVEASYLEAAREVADAFLAEGDLPSAWMYLQAIREPAKMAEAMDKLPDAISDYDQLDRLLQIALFQQAHPEKGVRLMLKGHGTCSTITALDQILPQMNPAQRAACARVMVRSLYDDVRESVQRHIEQRVPLLEPDLPLAELIAGRDWIFEGGSTHVDPSHLSSVIRFARAIQQPATELELAAELARYGSGLDQQLQYAGEPPFEDLFPAHLHFSNAILDRKREASLQYFRNKLAQEPDEEDRPVLAYVLVDLLMRCDQLNEAADVALAHLSQLGDDAAISLDDLCRRAERLGDLRKLRKQQQNPVGFVAALLQESSPPPV